jgi:hypothetical protein
MKRKENDLLRLTEETEEQEIEMGRRRNTQKKNTEQRKGRTTVWHRHPLQAYCLTAAVSLRHQQHCLATPGNLLTIVAPILCALPFLSFVCRT